MTTVTKHPTIAAQSGASSWDSARPVVVGLDPSERGIRGYRWAASYAELLGMRLEVHVSEIDLAALSSADSGVDLWHQPAHVSIVVDSERSTTALRRASDSASLLALGCPADYPGIPADLDLLALVSGVRCDVAVVRGTAAARNQEHHAVTALLGANMSVVDHAAELAWRLGADLWLRRGLVSLPRQLPGASIEREAQLLDAATSRARVIAPDIKVQAELSRTSPHALASTSQGSDLLVVGSGVRLSPITRYAIQHASSPVLVIRASAPSRQSGTRSSGLGWSASKESHE